MKIGVIGTGNVGAALGRRWAQGGHTVVFGTRDPHREEVQHLVAEAGGTASARPIADALAAADVVVLATPWPIVEKLAAAHGGFAGKTVIDCTNPIAPGLAGLAVGTTTSAAEQLAAWAPDARVVKAFNATGAEIMADPAFPDGAATMFVCSDDEAARHIALTLATELGFEAVDAGPLRAARYLEPLAMLWIHLAYAAGQGRDTAFRYVRR